VESHGDGDFSTERASVDLGLQSEQMGQILENEADGPRDGNFGFDPFGNDHAMEVYFVFRVAVCVERDQDSISKLPAVGDGVVWFED